MDERTPWAQVAKAREDPQLSRFLRLATAVANVLFLLAFVAAIAALVTLSAVRDTFLAWLAVAGQALGALALFLLGALVSAGAEVLARCVVSVEQPGATSTRGS